MGKASLGSDFKLELQARTFLEKKELDAKVHNTFIFATSIFLVFFFNKIFFKSED